MRVYPFDKRRREAHGGGTVMSEPCKVVYSSMLDTLIAVTEQRPKGGYSSKELDWMVRLEEDLKKYRMELLDDWKEAIQ